MPRVTQIPTQEIREDIRWLEEYPSAPGVIGQVNVHVASMDSSGAWLTDQSPKVYQICGSWYELLIGDGSKFPVPGKPTGTYRNDDLFYFVDLLRAGQRPPEESHPGKDHPSSLT